jgi:ankyrin repeat protein
VHIAASLNSTRWLTAFFGDEENKQLINVANSLWSTPLHCAAYNNTYGAALLLIELGANVNARNLCGKGPLWYAVEKSHVSMVQLLLNNDADVAADYKEQWIKSESLLDCAKKIGNNEIIGLLQQALANRAS